MDLSLARAALPALSWLDSASSTNQEMRKLVVAYPRLAHGAAVATADQRAGRGRLGREWQTPRGTALAVSFLIRGVPLEGGAGAGTGAASLGLSWLPLLAGSAVASAVRDELPDARVAVKWPNDVHIFDRDTATRQGSALHGGIGRKVCGILCELLPGYANGLGDVVAGIGINLLAPPNALPTPTATSLLIEGGSRCQAVSVAEPSGAELFDRVLARTGAELLRLVALAQEHPAAARARVEADSATLGASVRAHLPSGEIIEGTAHALAADGSLVLEREGQPSITVTAGDVQHLR